MGFLFDLITLPVLGAPKLVLWLAGIVAEEMEREAMDEGRVRSELMELQQQYETGELADEDYDRQERALLERLNTIRESKAQRSSP